MGKINREAIFLLNRTKEPGVDKKELTELCNHYIKLMHSFSVSTKIRKELYNYSFNPAENKEKIINIMERCLISIYRKNVD